MATQTRPPTSDQTVSGTWSGTAGSRYTLVNDYPDAASTKLTGGTATSVITFGFAAFSIPAGSGGISVQVQYYDGEATSGTNNAGGRIVVGGSTYNATTHNPSGTTGTARSDNWATNPKTGAAWTVDDVNGVGASALQQFGINSSDSNPAFFIGSIRLQVTYTPPASGTLAATEAGQDTASFDGTVSASAITGTLAATEDGADAASFEGSVSWPVITGALAADELGQDTASLAGSLSWAPRTGTLDATDAQDTCSLAGTVSWPVRQGTLAATDSPDTASLSGIVLDPIQGSMAVLEQGQDACSLAGAVLVQGTCAAQEGSSDTLSAAGQVLVQGSLTASDPPDTMSCAGTVQGQGEGPEQGDITGVLAAVEGMDTALLLGVLSHSAAPPTVPTHAGQGAGGGGVLGGGRIAAYVHAISSTRGRSR